MSKPTLGKSTAGAAVSIDVERLVSTRALLCANSGGGKSWAIRRILEQTHGSIQQLVIDPEGEFFTLREGFDYILAGKGGDCPAEPRSAALLARKLLELGTSAILDLYELAPRERVRFVRLFLEALIDAPKDLWHPVLVVIDEAHAFAPEKGSGEAESVEAVSRLMAQGRKRGFAGVLATQRLSKLAKDVAAEANNVLVGRAVLDVDQKRAAAALGISAGEAAAKLRELKPGHFYTFGPALSTQVVEVHVGEVSTSHPKAGQRSTPPPPARGKVLKVLGQLADLPKEAEDEARTITEAKTRIRELERELAAAKKAQPAAKVERVEVPVLTPADREELSNLRTAFELSLSNHERNVRTIAKATQEALERLDAAARQRVGMLSRAQVALLAPPAASNGHAPAPRPRAVQPAADRTSGVSDLASGQRKILTALAQYPDGRTKSQVAILTGYAVNGGGFCNYLSSLRTRGCIEGAGDNLRITQTGEALLGTWEPLPEGDALLQHWLGQLGKAEREVLTVLARHYPSPLTKEQVAAETETQYAADGGGFNNALSRLRTLELVSGRGELVASADLFG